MQQETAQFSQQQIPNEPLKWHTRYLLYRDAGQERSLLKTYRDFQAQKGNGKHYNHVPGAWTRASEIWHWYARATQYDALVQEREEARRRVLFELEQAEIEKILTTGYALKHKRIQALAEMADRIEHSMLYPDGTVNFARLSPEKIKEFRGCLADIASEMGHRVKKNELSGKDGGLLMFVTEWAGGPNEDDKP